MLVAVFFVINLTGTVGRLMWLKNPKEWVKTTHTTVGNFDLYKLSVLATSSMRTGRNKQKPGGSALPGLERLPSTLVQAKSRTAAWCGR